MKNTAMKIFIIDDDAVWTKVLSQQLINKGFENIEAFDNGQAGLDNLSKEPAVIFLDYQMEEEDGLSILKKVKAYNESIQVIFCTSHEDLSVALSAMENGSLDFLLKTNLNESELERLLLGVN